MPRFTPIVDTRPVDEPWPPLQWPISESTALRGRFVELTPVDPERDASALFNALNHDAVWAHLRDRPADTDEFAASLRDAWSGGRLPWVVRLIRDHGDVDAGTVVGTSSYLDVSVGDARLEIGWTAYHPAVWASAVNPETKLLLLAHAFDVLGAGRVQLKTDVRNTRSQEAIARLGAQYEGTLRRYQRRADDTMRDTVFFSILADEWPSVRDGLNARLDIVG